MRASGGAQTLLLVGRNLPLAGGALDDPGLDSGVADALRDLGGIDLRDFIHAALLEVRRVAQVFLVQPGGADDADTGRVRDLRHKAHVTPDIHRAWVDKGPKP
jgi:hypothetical protein